MTIIRVYSCENLPEDRDRIKQVLGKECELEWTKQAAIDEVGKGNCEPVLNQIKAGIRDCLLLDLALTDQCEKDLENVADRTNGYAGLDVSSFGGGFAVLEEVLNKQVMPDNKIAVLTQYAKTKYLEEMIKQKFGRYIPVFQKRDYGDEARLQKFVYSCVGIDVKDAYMLISDRSEEDVKLREAILNDLETVGTELRIKWRSKCRVSLSESKEYAYQDGCMDYDLVIFDLLLNDKDAKTFDAIQGKWDPPYDLTYFSILKFAVEFLDSQDGATVIYLSESENRSLVSFLLHECKADWVVRRDTLTKSLIAIFLKLMISNGVEA